MKKIALLLGFLCVFGFVSARRFDWLINDNWQFRFGYQVQRGSGQLVQLPHTWNALDADVRPDYYRGEGNYTKDLFVDSSWKGKRLFLRFEGANTVANVFVNGKHIGEHRGGYGAFVFEITHAVRYGQNNRLLVRVSNALRLDVMPLVGDFNFYGGIYRDVHLVMTDGVNISLTDYASSGVYLVQKQVSHEQACVCARVCLSNNEGSVQKRMLSVRIMDGSRVVSEHTREVEVVPGESKVGVDIRIQRPHLWNGRQDPFIYRAEVRLLENGHTADSVSQPLGLRYFRVDADKGFFLNGHPLKLHGVCRHQERSEVGNALRRVHHEEDAAIMAEMGVNAVRLAHYPQASYMYDLMDRYGFVTWAEIPFVGPGGYQDCGYVDMESFRANGRQQLREMIRQHYNHPSICFWGLFNELKTEGDDPTEYVRQLNELAHSEDSTRLTTAASNLAAGNPIGMITDLMAWNQYFGWYGGEPADMGRFLDATHRAFPKLKIGISEYGAGGSVAHQQDSVVRGLASGYWHPENYQTYYHMENWKAMAERPFVWGTFVWNMFDFGAAHRTEGDRPGINDKGLVSRDRKVRKDAFYFYKANWNREEPMVYLANRRNDERTERQTTVMAFTNCTEAELIVNGVSAGKCVPDAYATCLWKNVSLRLGENVLEVRAGRGRHQLADRVVWHVR